MVSITAQNLLDENNYTEDDDISAANVEAVTDIIIDYINLEAGTTIPVFRDQAGAAGSRTITVTSTQSPLIKVGAGLMMRAYVDRGPNTSFAGVGVAAIISDPQFTLLKTMLNQGINRIRGRSFERT